MPRWDGVRATVMGLGRFGGGAGAARYLAERGARVVATDLRDADALPEARAALAGLEIEWALGAHRERDFDGAELVIANPAVRPDHPLLARARGRGARVTTEVELFLAELPCAAIGITGTQGKSSTTAFTAQLLGAAGRRVHAGGNLGGSLLSSLSDIGPGDVVALELSSYQLEHLAVPPVAARGLAAAAVLNVLDDHLERHGTRAAYASAKARLFELLADDGVAIVPSDVPGEARWPLPRRARRLVLEPSTTASAARADDAERLALRGSGALARFALAGEHGPPLDALALPAFQRPNALAALALARALGASSDALAAALPRLVPPEHRLEDLGLRGGRRVLDNGVSTTPDSTLAALACVEGPVVLVVGGQAKQLDYGELASVAAARARAVIVFGAARDALAALLRAAGLEPHRAEDAAAAARAALEVARAGDTVLFSPACASFDGYANFKERALAFRAALPPRDAP